MKVESGDQIKATEKEGQIEKFFCDVHFVAMKDYRSLHSFAVYHLKILNKILTHTQTHVL